MSERVHVISSEKRLRRSDVGDSSQFMAPWRGTKCSQNLNGVAKGVQMDRQLFYSNCYHTDSSHPLLEGSKDAASFSFLTKWKSFVCSPMLNNFGT